MWRAPRERGWRPNSASASATPAQMDLPLTERAKNVRGAFHCPRLTSNASVAVLDDVMNTGATLDEMAATLKRAGAARVGNWVIARTFPPTPPY